ncbi:MAG: protease modulator HflC, partial [Lachnospiraceae bacterium]|nr:protease modulator HflC [Lachnospiraceae bacterium]
SQAQIIINETDRTVQIGLSDARAEAAVIVAEGEAEYMRILAEAYNTPEKQAFYAFVRALDAAKISMTDEDVLMIDEDSPLAQIFMGY